MTSVDLWTQNTSGLTGTRHTDMKHNNGGCPLSRKWFRMHMHFIRNVSCFVE